MDKHSSIFFEEAVDLLAQLEGLLIDLEENHSDVEQINLLLRILHTLKGSGSMFGYNDLAAFVHIIESVFEKVRNGEWEITPDLIEKTLQSRDQMVALITPDDENTQENLEAVTRLSAFFLNFGRQNPLDSFANAIERKASKTPKAKEDKDLDAEIEMPSDSTEDASQSSELNSDTSNKIASSENELLEKVEITEKPKQTWEIFFEPLPNYFSFGNNPLSILQEISDLGEVEIEVDSSDVPEFEKIDPETCYLKWKITLNTTADENSIRDVFIFVEDLCHLTIKLMNNGENQSNEEEFENTEIKSEPAIAKDNQEKDESASVFPNQLTDSDQFSNIKDQFEESYVETIQKIASMPLSSSNSETEPSNTYEVGNEDRSEYQKIDHLINLLGELVTIQARLSQNASSSGDAELVSLAQELEILTGDLRDSALKMSMLPVGSVFTKLIEIAEEKSRVNGKQIEISVKGWNTEIDKELLDRLFQPLKKLIENSIEHGFESPELRELSGKPVKGVLNISAWQSTGNFYIEISDDGAGIDPEELKRVIVERNPKQFFDSKETDLFKLICMATNLSKAGSHKALGLASVKKTVNGMRGSLELKSSPGKGTSFIVKLPLNLGIVEGLMVKLGENLFLIPLSSVEECIELTKEDQKRNFEKNVVMVRGQIVPYMQLRETFEIEGEPPDIQQIVITFVDQQRIGFVVDQVIGEYQTVIKSWGKFCNDIPGISGATILGDGTVALIADPGILIRGQSNKSLNEKGEANGF